MPGWEVRACASVPGRSVRPGRSPPVPGRGGSSGSVRDRIGDRYCRGRSGACGRELLVVTGLPGDDRGEAPHVKKPSQPLVAGRVVRGIDRLVVLAEELLALSFGEVSEDHQRIGGVLRWLCGHGTQLTPAQRPQPARRTGQDP
jgi:hypothetical protein